MNESINVKNTYYAFN